MTPTKDRRKAGLTPLERLTEAALTYAEAETAVDDDRAWRRALDNLCASAERYVSKLWRDRAREAQRRARRRGKKPGRPAGSFRGTSRWSRWRREKYLDSLVGDFSLNG